MRPVKVGGSKYQEGGVIRRVKRFSTELCVGEVHIVADNRGDHLSTWSAI